MWTKLITASLFVCLVPIFTIAQSTYAVTDLGPLSPTGINAWAQVVGNYNRHAYLWTKGQGVRDLGLLAGGTFSRAVEINDRGIVAGFANGAGTVVSLIPDYVPNQQCTDLTQPFIWSARNGLRGLGTVGVRSDPVYWCSIRFYTSSSNVRNEVIGNHGVFETYQDGFLWTKDGGMILLDFGSWPPSFANGVNSKGQVVGESSDRGYFIPPGHAIFWDDGVSTDLGTLGGTDIAWGSSANGINDSGQIVGWSTISGNFEMWQCVLDNTSANSYNGCPVYIHAVLWANGHIRDLGTLAGDTLSTASKINVFGEVIGNSGNTMIAQLSGEPGGSIGVIGHPFVWTARTKMRDLNTLIPRNSGWVLQTATDINMWGQIVGFGRRNGQPHGYLLTPENSFAVF